MHILVDKAVFKVYTNIISKILTAVTAVLFIRVGGRIKYLSNDFINPLYSKRNMKIISNNLIVTLSKHALPITIKPIN